MTSARRRAALALVVIVAIGAPALALARDGGEGGGRSEARAAGSCPGGGRWELRARGEDGAIALELRARAGHALRAGTWRVVVLHERRIAWRASVRAGSSGLRVRRVLPDYEGPDGLAARATPPGGGTCSAQAVLPAEGS